MDKVFKVTYLFVWTLLIPILSLLAYTIVPKWKPGLKMKWGNFPFNFKPHSIWFHAVSVGELNALIPLLKYFEGLNLVLSTSTSTAQEMAKVKLKKQIENNEIQLIYMPWDHPVIISQTLRKMKPSLIVILETEIWPSLINIANEMHIPVSVINARLADKSFANYKKFYFIFHWIFSKISMVLAQSPNDSRKFLELGVDKKKLFMTGNIKFAIFPNIKAAETASLRAFLGYSPDDCILIASSTHPEEEAYMINTFQELKESFPNLRLIIAPRHPERFNNVEDFIQSAAHLQTVRFTKVKEYLNDNLQPLSKDAPKFINNQNDVLMIDTIGDLSKLISIGSIAFVGGTIAEKVGGHNVLEPAVYGLPVVVGPYTFKNTETVEMMKEAGALLQGETVRDIKFAFLRLLENPDERVLMGARAKNLIDENKKIVLDTSEKLKSLLLNKERTSYV